MDDSPLSAERFDRLEAEITRWFLDGRDVLVKGLLSAGRPPFHDPAPDMNNPSQAKAFYDRLVALRGAMAPEFWGSQEAQQSLDLLAQRYGPPPPMPMQTFVPEGVM